MSVSTVPSNLSIPPITARTCFWPSQLNSTIGSPAISLSMGKIKTYSISPSKSTGSDQSVDRSMDRSVVKEDPMEVDLSPQGVVSTSSTNSWYTLIQALNQTNVGYHLLDWLRYSSRRDSHHLFMSFNAGRFQQISLDEWLEILYREQSKSLEIFYQVLLDHSDEAAEAIALINEHIFRVTFSPGPFSFKNPTLSSRLGYASSLEETITMRHYYSSYRCKHPLYQHLLEQLASREPFWPLASYLIALDDPEARNTNGQSIIYVTNLSSFWKQIWIHLLELPVGTLIGSNDLHQGGYIEFCMIMEELKQTNSELRSWLGLFPRLTFNLVADFYNRHPESKLDLIKPLKAALMRRGWNGLPILPDEFSSLICRVVMRT